MENSLLTDDFPVNTSIDLRFFHLHVWLPDCPLPFQIKLCSFADSPVASCGTTANSSSKTSNQVTVSCLDAAFVVAEQSGAGISVELEMDQYLLRIGFRESLNPKPWDFLLQI